MRYFFYDHSKAIVAGGVVLLLALAGIFIIKPLMNDDSSAAPGNGGGTISLRPGEKSVVDTLDPKCQKALKPVLVLISATPSGAGLPGPTQSKLRDGLAEALKSCNSTDYKTFSSEVLAPWMSGRSQQADKTTTSVGQTTSPSAPSSTDSTDSTSSMSSTSSTSP